MKEKGLDVLESFKGGTVYLDSKTLLFERDQLSFHNTSPVSATQTGTPQGLSCDLSSSTGLVAHAAIQPLYGRIQSFKVAENQTGWGG